MLPTMTKKLMTFDMCRCILVLLLSLAMPLMGLATSVIDQEVLPWLSERNAAR
jgi:hypothetical protein